MNIDQIEEKVYDHERQIGQLIEQVKNVVKGIDDLKTATENALKLVPNYKEFNIVRTIVFGMVGIVLTSVFGAIVSLVVMKF